MLAHMSSVSPCKAMHTHANVLRNDVFYVVAVALCPMAGKRWSGRPFIVCGVHLCATGTSRRRHEREGHGLSHDTPIPPPSPC